MKKLVHLVIIISILSVGILFFQNCSRSFESNQSSVNSQFSSADSTDLGSANPIPPIVNPPVTNPPVTTTPQTGNLPSGIPYSSLPVNISDTILNQHKLSPFSLEIIQPAAGLDSKNRFYKAYPGIAYNVTASVIGGSFPYTYFLDLKAAPEMTINSNTGEINWPSPVERAASYPVTLRVLDSLGVSRSVTWSIQVTKQGFAFVDAVNGSDTNDGSINAPWKTFVKVYGGTDYASKWSDTPNKDKFIYFKSGTYYPDGYTAGQADLQYTSNQPMVFLAYPNQATMPIFDMRFHYFRMNTSTDNFYVDGLEIKNANQPPGGVNVPGEYYFAFRLDGGSHNVTFRNNYFNHLDGTNGGSNNQSFIMAAKGSAKGQRWAVINNEFNDIKSGYGIIGYTTTKLLFANNVLRNIKEGIPIGPKDSCDLWFIRQNTLLDVGERSIWLNGTTDGGSYQNIEVSFNYVKANPNAFALHINQSQQASITGVHVHHNTFVGGVQIFMMSDSAPMRFTNNVVINNVNSTNIVDKITWENPQISQGVIFTDNLVRTTTP